MRTLIVIPARMHSTRLPGKPMVDIAGEPMTRGG
jgi:3-deoxy-manno-octulosonate cytidylyltransferase (CMP-KDO synthetase)